jgi:transcriptional regulator with XRE-family HTH domain
VSEIDAVIGTNCRLHRKMHGETLADLADVIGVGVAQVSKLELAHQEWHARHVKKVADHYGINPGALFVDGWSFT